MNKLVKKIFLALILPLPALSAFAEIGQPRSERENGREFKQQKEIAGGNGAYAARSFQYPESDGSSEDNSKKQNRLSPEERRNLRRQINEAGQDLYSRKR